MGFSGWPTEALDFLEDLEDNNERSWFQANKAVYDAAVRGPMVALLEELAPEFGPAKVFRVNRDVRFAKDKRPYKTNVAGQCGVGRYASLFAGGLQVGCGRYGMGRDELARYREAVAGRPGAQLERVVADLEGQGLVIAGDALATAPRGYPRDHPRIELLRRKGIYAWAAFGLEPWLHAAQAKGKVAAVWRAAQPLEAWLDEHVGPAAPAAEP